MKEVEKKEIDSREDCEWFGLRTVQKPCGTCNKDCQYNDNKTQKDCQIVKEIEEMAKIMCVNCVENETLTCSYKKDEVPCCFANYFAEALYNAGYGKVDDYKKEIERLKEDRIKAYTEMNEACTRLQLEAIKEFAEKLTMHIFKYLGVKDIQEASSLSLIDSTLTYDVITNKIDDLLKEYGIGETK